MKIRAVNMIANVVLTVRLYGQQTQVVFLGILKLDVKQRTTKALIGKVCHSITTDAHYPAKDRLPSYCMQLFCYRSSLRIIGCPSER